ncbi:DUF1778 domain-containing protein [Luteimonas sp. TWI1416]|uniref:type II toxin-antitoxin system TacA family antitoxin n=1 Tax=unclassified Luteimonas TaxID=2629088 RepID=UPI003207E189
MPTTSRPPIKRETLNLRIRVEDRALIDRAAKTLSKNRTDFVLAAARAAAEEALLDQATFHVDSKAYAAFLARLDQPPEPNVQLRTTMQTPAPWDTATQTR